MERRARRWVPGIRLGPPECIYSPSSASRPDAWNFSKCVSHQVLDLVGRHGWVTAARRSYIADMAFATERAVRLLGDRAKPAGFPPVPLEDPTGVHRFAWA